MFFKAQPICTRDKFETNMDDSKNFASKNHKSISKMSKDKELQRLSKEWFLLSHKYEYSYHFTWLGRPIIQFPHDMIAIQELIWKVKPDLIIETGIARGGSLIFSASILELIGKGKVLGVDVDIRKHNRKEIEKHPLFKRITMIEGSSVDPTVISKIRKFASDKKKIMVFLDSNHSHKHVLKELKIYSSFISKGSYIIVFDTVIEDMPKDWLKEQGIDRPWNKTDNPKTAVYEFLKKNKRFKIDNNIQKKLLISTAPDGYLKCIKN